LLGRAIGRLSVFEKFPSLPSAPTCIPIPSGPVVHP
jgi:hypothetical protein